MSIYITKKDKFVWLDITNRCNNSVYLRELWAAHELYEVHPDDTERLIESVEDVISSISMGNIICIEVGRLEASYTSPKPWLKTADTKVIDGYLYVKVNDVLRPQGNDF